MIYNTYRSFSNVSPGLTFFDLPPKGLTLEKIRYILHCKHQKVWAEFHADTKIDS
jgi:hypothetical protein